MLLARATRQASRALDDGIRKAFVARRAVEFRLGLDLEQERGRHTFVEPPQTWANDIFRIGSVAVAAGGGGPGTEDGVMADLDLA